MRLADVQAQMTFQVDSPAGSFFVFLDEGLFRDRVSTWKDVWPALGGRIAVVSCRHGKGRGAVLFRGSVRVLIDTLRDAYGFEMTSVDDPAGILGGGA